MQLHNAYAAAVPPGVLRWGVVHEEEPRQGPGPRDAPRDVEHRGPAPRGAHPAAQRRREAPEQRRGSKGEGLGYLHR